MQQNLRSAHMGVGKFPPFRVQKWRELQKWREFELIYGIDKTVSNRLHIFELRVLTTMR